MSENKEKEGVRYPLPHEEPICRVGIVLEADNKSKVALTVPEGEFIFMENDSENKIRFAEETYFEIEVDEGQIECKTFDGNVMYRSREFIGIRREGEGETLAPRSGILLKGIVAGRGFHWRKEVDLYFPYTLEFHQKNNKLIVVNSLPLEPYLACVVTSEMSAQCPREFIKAQATAARSWMIVNLEGKHKGLPYTICNDDCCQRYQGTTYLSSEVAVSVDDCRGMFLIAPSGNVCSAFYSKCCGGIIERGSNIFGNMAEGLSESTDAPDESITNEFNPITEDTIREWVMGDWVKESDSFCSPNTCPENELPKYLGAVDEEGAYYRWRVGYTNEELVELLKRKARMREIDEFVDFKVLKRGNSGRIHNLEIVYKDKSGKESTWRIGTQYAIRNALHDSFLFSSAFVWDYERTSSGGVARIILNGAGWGHGAGLCQMGALGMALKGYSYEDILHHYFDTATLKKGYE